ncbi:MAG TPA: hypothetical protein VE621_20830 [Bryobacteraceae bacterium]|nr:hypothetical protein [Bryobacteraceae bacterium]
MNTRRNATIAFLAVFVSGIVVGVFGHRVYAVKTVSAVQQNPPSPEQWRAQYVSDMRSRLKLNDEQVQQINGILDDTRHKVKAVKDRYKPELKTIYDEQVARVELLLNEAQIKEYAAFREERKKIAQENEKKQSGK